MSKLILKFLDIIHISYICNVPTFDFMNFPILWLSLYYVIVCKHGVLFCQSQHMCGQHSILERRAMVDTDMGLRFHFRGEQFVFIHGCLFGI